MQASRVRAFLALASGKKRDRDQGQSSSRKLLKAPSHQFQPAPVGLDAILSEEETAAIPMTGVRIAVRCRPFNGRERGLQSECCVEMPGGGAVIVKKDQGDDEADVKKFAFDFAYWSHDGCEPDEHGMYRANGQGTPTCTTYADQETLFNDLGKPLLAKAVAGYSTCIFAYGQTGAGKSYSMTGAPNNEGVIPMVCRDLFERAAESAAAGAGELTCTVALLEIYGEEVRDLLKTKKEHEDATRSKKPIKLRDTPQGVIIENLKWVPVDGYLAVEKEIETGFANRTIAATAMNATSSRAHTVFTLRLERAKRNPATGHVTSFTGEINLVDLAGSERVSKTGVGQMTGDYKQDQANRERAKEGIAINQSLTALGNVISAIVDRSNATTAEERKKIYVNYRSSKLTHVLKPSLSGNSFTAMVAAVSPALDNFAETISTLQFANRMKQIKVTIKANVTLSPEAMMLEVTKLRAEVAMLQGLLSANGLAPSSSTSTAMVAFVPPLAARSGGEEPPSKQLSRRSSSLSRRLLVGGSKAASSTPAAAASSASSVDVEQIAFYEKEATELRAEVQEAQTKLEKLEKHNEYFQDLVMQHQEELEEAKREQFEAATRAASLQEELLRMRAAAGGPASVEDEAELARLRAELARMAQQRLQAEADAEAARVAELIEEKQYEEANAAAGGEVHVERAVPESSAASKVDDEKDDEKDDEDDDEQEKDEGEPAAELNSRELEMTKLILQLKRQQVELSNREAQAFQQLAAEKNQQAEAEVEAAKTKAAELEEQLSTLLGEREQLSEEREQLRDRVQREQEEKLRVYVNNQTLESQIADLREVRHELRQQGATADKVKERQREELQASLEAEMKMSASSASLSTLHRGLEEAERIGGLDIDLLDRSRKFYVKALRTQKLADLQAALNRGEAAKVKEALAEAETADVDATFVAEATMTLKQLERKEAWAALAPYADPEAVENLPDLSEEKEMLEELAHSLRHATSVGVLDEVSNSDANVNHATMVCARIQSKLIARAVCQLDGAARLDHYVPLTLLEDAVMALGEEYLALEEHQSWHRRGVEKLARARKAQAEGDLKKKFNQFAHPPRNLKSGEAAIGLYGEDGLEGVLETARKAGLDPKLIEQFEKDFKSYKQSSAKKELDKLTTQRPGGSSQKGKQKASHYVEHIEKLEHSMSRAVAEGIAKADATIKQAEKKIADHKREAARLTLKEISTGGTAEEVHEALRRAEELGVDRKDLDKAEVKIQEASLSYADGNSKIDLLRIDPDRLESEIRQRAGKLPKGILKRYNDKVKKVREAQSKAKKGEECTFLVIDAKKLRTSKLPVMMAMQELQTTNNDWFSEFTLSFADAVKQTWKKEFLAVSHRWEEAWHPDQSGKQLQCLVSFLRANEEIKYIWLECVTNG